ncbi:glutamate racemase [Geotoga petraea]|jgi:glutamate racemase|uniref:Glutamate racemase n=1 Tax=Geotoga petraea TaxID=28234 RepID=A0A1G6HVF3_9BACT|nr:glutamate racemase [Geotoga petraea]MDK2945327.1 glutamate racemase [Geotoga sp.]TGG88992.1 glutamate racemase [Geotoga petraea]SDB98299.1 glutamate racemase [Geotoga petraea]
MKIGFFDSGIGGLTVLKKVVRNFNNHDFYYFGDTLNVPYGSKPEYFLVNMLENIFDFFESVDVDILISACNTTDSLVKKGLVSLDDRSFKYISIIDNGIEQINKGEEVLLLATSNTVRSGSYRGLLVDKVKVKKVTEKACPLFVPLIEEGYWYGPMADSIINYYLRDCEGRYDKVILGCTHYPILSNHIQKIVKSKIVDPADGIVKTLLNMKLPYLKGYPEINFYISGSLEQFKCLSKRFLGRMRYKSKYTQLIMYSYYEKEDVDIYE